MPWCVHQGPLPVPQAWSCEARDFEVYLGGGGGEVSGRDGPVDALIASGQGGKR